MAAIKPQVKPAAGFSTSTGTIVDSWSCSALLVAFDRDAAVEAATSAHEGDQVGIAPG
jgi:hypothetical protein